MTLTSVSNSRQVDLAAIKKRLGEKGYAFDDGYGKIKGQTFRIAHMGDMQQAELDEFLKVLEGEIGG